MACTYMEGNGGGGGLQLPLLWWENFSSKVHFFAFFRAGLLGPTVLQISDEILQHPLSKILDPPMKCPVEHYFTL